MTKDQLKEAERLYVLGYNPTEIIARITTVENPVSNGAMSGAINRGSWKAKRAVYLAEIGKPAKLEANA